MPPPGRTPPIALHEFQASMQGLRQLVDVVAPHAAKLDPSSVTLDLDLSKEAEKELIAALKSISSEHREPGPISPELMEEFNTRAKRAITEDPDGFRQLGVVLSATYTPSQQELLHRALLAMCIASLEVLVASLAAYRYEVHPRVLGKKDIKLSLGELEDFQDLSEVREFALSREVDALMFEGFEGWVRWLQTNADLRLEELTSEYDLLYEAFQRRHAIVHNGGLVSRIYAARLQSRGLTPPPLNEKLNVDSDYLRTVLSELTFVGLALGVQAWIKWQPAESSLMELELLRYVDEAAIAEQWTVAGRLSEFGLEVAKKESARWQLKIAQLLAVKKMEGPDAIKARLESWDTSAVDGPFQLALAALEDDLDEVFAILDRVDLNRLPSPYWLEGPMFEKARSDPRWDRSRSSQSASAPGADSAE